ncbi:ABC transporter ATP-binding protein [Marivita sp.]|uniref:ABC transporter ATP-binding protein n=1 Tax=Marivita sp. TaxID=2003365 RepID=UPI003F722D3E
MAFVSLKNIKKSFGSVRVLNQINLDMEQGDFLVLLGPSGCGKSTLLRMIAGLETVTGGDIEIDANRVNDVHPKDRDIAMVFQNYALYPDKTVYDNMAFGLRMRRQTEQRISEAIAEAAEILGMQDLLSRKPSQLSGGQRQRVAVGRAMVRDPKVFLFDEPLSNLDAHLRVKMRSELIKLHQKLGTTMIYVTHDQVEAMTMGDKIAILNKGELVQFGTPLEVFHSPNSVFSASFIGSPSMNLHSGTLTQAEGASLELRIGDLVHGVPDACAEELRPYLGKEVVFGVRPQYLAVSQAGTSIAHETGTVFAAQIGSVEELGTETILHLEARNQTWTAVASDSQNLRAGQDVQVSIPAADSHYFDPNSEAVICHVNDQVKTDAQSPLATGAAT